MLYVMPSLLSAAEFLPDLFFIEESSPFDLWWLRLFSLPLRRLIILFAKLFCIEHWRKSYLFINFALHIASPHSFDTPQPMLCTRKSLWIHSDGFLGNLKFIPFFGGSLPRVEPYGASFCALFVNFWRTSKRNSLFGIYQCFTVW